MSRVHVERAARALRAGGVVAYPTEAVYGLGCDPLDAGAMRALLALKRRSPRKGVIVVAAEVAQIEPYVRFDSPEVRGRVEATWPGPVTWVLPARARVPRWLTGRHETLAVRVTAHPVAAALCRAFGRPVVSTSANRSGGRPARSALEVRHRFGAGLAYVVPGAVGGQARPTEIRDAASDAVLRDAGPAR